MNGILIRDISVYKSGKIIVNAENGTKKQFFVNVSSLGLSDSIFDYSADYLLCAIQHDKDIEVNK